MTNLKRHENNAFIKLSAEKNFCDTPCLPTVRLLLPRTLETTLYGLCLKGNYRMQKFFEKNKHQKFPIALGIFVALRTAPTWPFLAWCKLYTSKMGSHILLTFSHQSVHNRARIPFLTKLNANKGPN